MKLFISVILFFFFSIQAQAASTYVAARSIDISRGEIILSKLAPKHGSCKSMRSIVGNNDAIGVAFISVFPKDGAPAHFSVGCWTLGSAKDGSQVIGIIWDEDPTQSIRTYLTSKFEDGNKNVKELDDE
jgi:hypothetical protein